MNDYLNQESSIQSFYNRFPTIENFENQIKEKQQNYNPKIREILVSVLNKQYENSSVSELTKNNIAFGLRMKIIN
jgi:hypothetical protein